MLNHVPSGSKSSSSGLATGCERWNALRLAIIVQWPPLPMRITPLGMPGTPWEQPAPASSPYIVWPTKATLETPVTRLPRAGLVWLDGRPRTTWVTWPLRVTFEIRPPLTRLCELPVYGAAPPDACSHL